MPIGIYKHKKGLEANNWQGGKIIKICIFCNSKFEVFKCRIKTGRKYCSRLCSDKDFRKHAKAVISRRETDNYKHSEESKRKISLAKIGKKQSEKQKIAKSKYNKLMGIVPPINRMFGENNPSYGKHAWNWLKDRTKLKRYSTDRRNPECKRLRLLRLKFDNYRCMDCGEIKKGEMEVNHIYPWSKYPSLRYEFNNLETLCKDCHRIKTNAFMRKNKLLIYV